MPTDSNKPGKYRLRMTPVEAIQWDGEAHTANTFIGDGYTTDWAYVSAESEDIRITTPEWWRSRVRVGEWLIKNRDGVVTGCSDSVFKRMYEVCNAD